MLSLGPRVNKPPPGWRPDWLAPMNRDLKAWWLFNEGAGSQSYDITQQNADPVQYAGTVDYEWRGSDRGGGLWMSTTRWFTTAPALDDIATSGITASTVTSGALPAANGYLVAKTSDSTQGFNVLSNWGGVVWVWIQHSTTDLSHQVPHSGIWDDDLPHSHVFTWDGGLAASGVRQYIDGAEVAASLTEDGVGAYVSEVGRPLHLNRVGNRAGTYDDLRIWNRVLTPDEVAQLHAEPYG